MELFVHVYSMSVLMFVFFFKQKTAYEMRISDWSSDVCSSDLRLVAQPGEEAEDAAARRAARRARQEPAHADPVRAEETPGRDRHHLRVRHPRHGGGDAGVEPHRPDGHRPHRPDLDPRRAPLVSALPVPRNTPVLGKGGYVRVNNR